MHPDQIAILDFLGNGLGEKAVRFLVCFPGGFVKCDLTRVVVKQRPEDRVCKVGLSVRIAGESRPSVGWEASVGDLDRRIRTRESIIVPICEFIVNEDGYGTVLLLQTLLDDRDFGFWYLQTRPAIPLEGRGFGQTT